ncbi:tetratricopeptide repeat protein [Mucilaginibacter auburnensis]|uniref:Tetratricopeptide repeat protein n=1 Tax=Mucilaginibacter auburnensis TaxID=1457233 RepID=A0A2H9VP08_9SPHI|nr:tetratricopeptide repeat protein [Mucilaginibacter auburnensis]PJJ80040.1 tetratricopeptide repeat protein [Mucilaginibacter auburnensis]
MRFWATLSVCFMLLLNHAVAQEQHQIDILKKLVEKPGADTSKALHYIELSKLYYLQKPDTGAIYANKALLISDKLEFKRGRMKALTQVGFSLWLLGDPASALEAFFESNDIADDLNDRWTTARNYDGMACANLEQGEINDGIDYANKSVALFAELKDYSNMVNVLNDVSFGYQSIGKLNLALQYAKHAYQLALKTNNRQWLPLSLGNIGRIYSRLNKDSLALKYLRKAVQLDKHPKAWIQSNTYNTLADVYRKMGQRDSSIYYYRQGFKVATDAAIIQNALISSTMLARLYEGYNDAEAVKYYRKAIALKDSLSSAEKTKKFVLVAITDQRHKEELAEERKRAREVHEQNLQLLAIAVFIPFFLIVVLLLSRTKTHRRIIEFMSVLALLFVFEFITLLIHPLIGKITDHTPVLELLILVALAAVLVPLHHNLTHWLKHKLVDAHVAAAPKKHHDENHPIEVEVKQDTN